jgi:hypothetical protein
MLPLAECTTPKVSDLDRQVAIVGLLLDVFQL